MALRELDCPNCGAHLHDYAPGQRFACSYCGTQILAPGEDPAATQAKAEAELATAQAQAKAALDDMDAQTRAAFEKLEASTAGEPRGRPRWLLPFAVLFPIGLIAGIGAITWSVIHRVSEKVPGFDVPSLSEAAKGLEQSAKGQLADLKTHGIGGERLGWDDVGGHPIPVTIQGAPAVIGRTRDHGRDSALYVEAYDAASGERRWRIDDLSTYGQAYRNVHFVVRGDFVAVSDLEGRIRTHALEDGRRLRIASFNERVDDLCAPKADDEDAPTEVWVRLADRKGYRIDLESGERESANKRPKWCVRTRKESSKRARVPRRGRPKVKGQSLDMLLIDGELGVAIGHKKPGTAIPRASGFDPKTRKVSWQVDIPKVDLSEVRTESTKAAALSEGRFVAVYGAGTESWRLTAFDAADGTRLWDRGMPDIFAVDRVEWMTAADGFAYIERTGGLEIRRLEDGEMTAMLGHVSYDAP